MARIFDGKRPRAELTETEPMAVATGRVAPPAASFAALAARLHCGAAAQRRDGRPREVAGYPGSVRPHPVGGLPAALRSDVEARSGLAMGDVRVHRYSDKPARIGALAYAQGRDIHLGPGQERHLPHEAWHVVQQKQGRVRATGRVEGVAINDDAALEREADDPAGVRRDGTPPPTITTGPETIQRRVGFEFEMTGGWKFYGWNAGKGAKEIKTTKKSLFQLLPGEAFISADNGNVEFVTDPLETYGKVGAVVDVVAAKCEALARSGKTNFTAPENAFAKTHSGFDNHRIVAPSSGKDAKMQASFGMGMADVAKLVAYANTKPEDDDRATKRRKRAIPSTYAFIGDRDEHATALTYLDRAQTTARDAFAAAQDAAKTAAPHHEAQIATFDGNAKITGLLTMILKTLHDADAFGTRGEDAKYRFPLMYRTDFKSMLASIGDDEKAHLSGLWTGGHLGASLTQADGNLDARIFGSNYKADAGPLRAGPTRRAWLTSIFQGAAAKDILSPPEGYESHADTRARSETPEGLGAMGTDDRNPDLSVFELRGLNAGKPLPCETWTEAALIVAKLVAQVTGDARLAAPDP